jgi:hypothetical protein
MYLCPSCCHVYAYFDDYVLCLETGYGLFLLSVVASNQADLRVKQINIEISFHHILIPIHINKQN